jgi:thiosulfate reductase cytochrome b subunit
MNEKRLYRVNRFLAWVLVPVILVNFITGYASVHPRLFGWLIEKPQAFRAHMAIQAPTAALVLFHVIFHVRLALSRRGFRGALVDAILGCTWLSGIAGVVWLARLG